MLVEKSVIGGHCCNDWMEVREVTREAIEAVEQVAARLFQRKVCSSAKQHSTHYKNPLCSKAKKKKKMYMDILTRRSYSPYFIFLPGYLLSEECLTHSSHSEKKKEEKSQTRKQNDLAGRKCWQWRRLRKACWFSYLIQSTVKTSRCRGALLSWAQHLCPFWKC